MVTDPLNTMTDALWFFALVALSLVRDGDTWRPPYVDPCIEPDTFCPWPFDPLLLHGLPIGQYHCPSCGSMVMAALPHVDYVDDVGGEP